jgi:hypothetical protein
MATVRVLSSGLQLLARPTWLGAAFYATAKDGSALSVPANTARDVPTTIGGGQAFADDMRGSSGLGLGDGIKTHTDKWLVVGIRNVGRSRSRRATWQWQHAHLAILQCLFTCPRTCITAGRPEEPHGVHPGALSVVLRVDAVKLAVCRNGRLGTLSVACRRLSPSW